jgi:type IV secretory pathway VirB10-like protein
VRNVVFVRRVVALRSVLVVAGIIIGLVGVLVAMFECGALRRPVPEDAAPSRAVSTQRAPSPMERTPVPRPALPQAAPANAEPAVRPSARAVTKLVLTQIKVQKYVEEAYPAWLQAHPGEDCPRKLIELNEYMEDKDANDAWGRPLKMFCSRALKSGAKGIKVISLGRDGEQGSEDDIKFGE